MPRYLAIWGVGLRYSRTRKRVLQLLGKYERKHELGNPGEWLWPAETGLCLSSESVAVLEDFNRKLDLPEKFPHHIIGAKIIAADRLEEIINAVKKRFDGLRFIEYSD